MTSRKRTLLLVSAMAAGAAFAAAPSVFARGGAGVGGGRGDVGNGGPDDGSQPPPEEQIGGMGTGTSGSKADGLGGMDVGDPVERAAIARDVFRRMCRDDVARLRDACNRRSADPAVRR